MPKKRKGKAAPPSLEARVAQLEAEKQALLAQLGEARARADALFRSYPPPLPPPPPPPPPETAEAGAAAEEPQLPLPSAEALEATSPPREQLQEEAPQPKDEAAAPAAEVAPAPEPVPPAPEPVQPESQTAHPEPGHDAPPLPELQPESAPPPLPSPPLRYRLVDAANERLKRLLPRAHRLLRGIAGRGR